MSTGLSGLEPLYHAFQTFTKKLMETGISDEFKAALESVKEFFMSLNSQSIIERKTIGKLLSVVKKVFVLVRPIPWHIMTIRLMLALAY